MIDLSKISGLPIELDEQTGKLKFSPPLSNVEPSVRKFAEVQPVAMDKNATCDREELYYMYRDVHLVEDEKTIRDHKIRYDLTVLPPAKIGQEFTKTLGHYHSLVPNEPFAYPEIYEVIHGHALFLIQKLDENGKVRVVIAIEGKPGDKIIYPPNYGHIIVNIGTDPVVTANWVSEANVSSYEPIVDQQGMAYYVVASESKPYEFVANPKYQDVPPVRMIGPNIVQPFKISTKEPMYKLGVSDPDKLDFLNNPHKYAVELSTITS